MKVYNYNSITGEYIGENEADKNPLEPGKYLVPAYATDKQPLQTGQNQINIFKNGSWVIKDNYRGQVACEVNSNGFFLKQHQFAIGEKPSDTIILTNVPDSSIYKPKWDGSKWIQGETPPVIAPQPTQQEILNAKLLKDNANMQIELDKQKQLNADLLLKVAKLGGSTNV